MSSLLPDIGTIQNQALSAVRVADKKACVIFSGQFFRNINLLVTANPLRRLGLARTIEGGTEPEFGSALRNPFDMLKQNNRFGFDPFTMTIDVVDPEVIETPGKVFAETGSSDLGIESYTNLLLDIVGRVPTRGKEVQRIYNEYGLAAGLRAFVDEFVKPVRIDLGEIKMIPHPMLHYVEVTPASDGSWGALPLGRLSSYDNTELAKLKVYTEFFTEDFGDRSPFAMADAYRAFALPGITHAFECPIIQNQRYRKSLR